MIDSPPRGWYVQDVAKHRFAAPPRPEWGVTPSLERVHVLVVEDDEDAREIIRTTLRFCGALVTDVSSAKKALEALTKMTPDVIVSDLAMPDNDGLEFMREVRLSDTLHSVPAIAITAYEHRFPQAAVMAAGFNVVMNKPLDPPDLLRAVARVLGA